MVAAFHQAGIQVKINDIVIGCSEAKENTCEVVAIEFAAPVSASFDTHTRTEDLSMRENQFRPKVSLERSGFGLAVDQSIVEVN